MYDLVSVVGHVKDTTMEDNDDGGDNLVAHIRVSPLYHLRKEVQHVDVSSDCSIRVFDQCN